MYIENPEKLLSTPIFGSDGQLWIVAECTRLTNAESRGHTYEFKLVTDVPVKSSPNQVYYSMTKVRSEKVELTMYKVDSEGIFEMVCNGMIEHGYTKDIDTIAKFTYRLNQMLPTCLQ